TTPARTHSCGWCSTTPRAGSARWLRGASPATRDTGFSARLEASDACGSPARLYIEAAFAVTCPATVTNRESWDQYSRAISVGELVCFYLMFPADSAVKPTGGLSQHIPKFRPAWLR